MLTLPIDPLLRDIVSVARERGVVVLEAPPGAVVIESGKRARLAPEDASEDWLVTGRGERLEVALERGGEFRGVGFRDFVLANPRFLDGQVVDHDGRRWRVEAGAPGGIELRSGQERRPISVRALLDAHLDTFRSRAVLIVDKG